MATRMARVGVTGCLAAAAALAASGCGQAATPTVIFITPPPQATPTLTFIPFEPPTDEATEPGAATDTATPAATATATAVPTPTPTPGPTASPTGVPALALIASTTVTDSGNSAQCGAWHVTFKKPVVSGVSGAVAINAAVTAKVTGYINDFKAQLPHGGGAGPCSLDGTYSIGLNSKTLLSIRFTIVEALGGASVGTLAGGLNFGVADGVTIALADLFANAAAGAGALSTQSRALLLAKLGPDGVDASYIDPGTTAAMSNFDKAWVFTTAGLEVTFAEVQVAPAVEGTPTITIPWASIKAVLAPNGPAGQFAH
jgi:hypothetical protein